MLYIYKKTFRYMSFKIDTKEKFTVITPLSADFNKQHTAELTGLLTNKLQESIPHCILSLQHVQTADPSFFQLLLEMHEHFYQENHSLVLCNVSVELLATAIDPDAIEMLNITPTESEAWDIVQMEEMEREFMRDEDAG
jgi:anti-anti-sigma regulatory factor